MIPRILRVVGGGRLLGLLGVAGGAACGAGRAGEVPHTPEVDATAPALHGAALHVRNNHEHPYHGPVELPVRLPDGRYAGAQASAEVRDGIARVQVALPAHGAVTLHPVGGSDEPPFGAGPLRTVPGAPSRLELRWREQPLASLELGLVTVGGDTAKVEDGIRRFTPVTLAWRSGAAGLLHGAASHEGYDIAVTATPYGAGVLDMRARVVRTAPTTGPAYVAVIRRVTLPTAPGDARLRFNGREFTAGSSPDIWDRDFWYTHGVDWARWTADSVAMLAVSGFTPTPTILTPKGAWAEGSYFYVRERTRLEGNAMYLVSELSGPNPGQATSRYMPITQYAPIRQGDTLRLDWRLAAAAQPHSGWEEIQMRAFAGFRRATSDSSTSTAGTTTIDVGVPAVAFGTSYFPYSTFNENFDYYRLPGTNQETWWPISSGQWREWRKYVPRMRTDLHIIRALGFDWVRLHHLELLHHIEHGEALAFLDFYMGEVRALGMKVLIDSEGPGRWIAQVAGRYPDLIRRVELENEILIMGIKPGDAERWTAMYRETKAAAPDAQVFLTTAGNHGQFERLRELGVPFDRIGLHAYKHGPQWKESFSSHALGTGGYASSLDMEATLGEFNWKEFTRMSPEARAEHVAETYRQVLAPRALPELMQFHFQETMSISPAISRSGVRHYEPMFLDRRLKREGEPLRDAIRTYTRADAPVRVLPIEIAEVRLVDGRALGTFRMTNASSRPLAVMLRAYAFDGTQATLGARSVSSTVSLQPGEVHQGEVALALPHDAKPGTYHYFVRADYSVSPGAPAGGLRPDYAVGWGVAANVGAPQFSASVLGDRVTYTDGADPASLDWSRPVAVTFGAKAHWLEMEMAYLLANTIQAATGAPVRLSSDENLLEAHRTGALLVAVGTAAMNPLVAEAVSPMGAVVAGSANGSGVHRGIIAIHREGGRERLVVTGATKEAVEAAAMDLLLRYWPQAKDAAIGISGREPGQLLGTRANVTNPDPP